jgi:hypothetical protein
MTRVLLFVLPLCILIPPALAEELPPPQNPADANPKTPPQVPALVPPQNAPANNAAAPGEARGQPANNAAALPANKNAAKPAGKPPEFFAARRQAQRDRKQAAIARMRQFKADRAAAEEKLYQDWHERYLADTPVRVEYYRALARAYEADALAWRTPWFFAAGPPVIVPVIYAPVIYVPAYPPPVYGTFISWGW